MELVQIQHTLQNFHQYIHHNFFLLVIYDNTEGIRSGEKGVATFVDEPKLCLPYYFISDSFITDVENIVGFIREEKYAFLHFSLDRTIKLAPPDEKERLLLHSLQIAKKVGDVTGIQICMAAGTSNIPEEFFKWSDKEITSFPTVYHQIFNLFNHM